MTTIGIIGAGSIGSTLGRLWHRHGHLVYFASRHPESLDSLKEELGEGVAVGGVADAFRIAEIVLLAVPFSSISIVAREARAAPAKPLILDATNPFSARDGKLAVEAIAGGHGSGVWTANQFMGSVVVKTFNTLNYKKLWSEAHRQGDLVGMPIAGDDGPGLDIASHLVRDAGFEPVIVGALDASSKFEFGTPVFNSGMSAAEMKTYFSLR